MCLLASSAKYKKERKMISDGIVAIGVKVRS